jgi:KUP system potassium uptake protein
VFLAITGAEALYADMGHFGPKPIRLAWFVLVFPALMINCLGQGALALREPAALKNPFYLLAPEPLLLPLVVLATAATVIASQATISGAFSITLQATRLGYLPRVPVRHTSASERGQIYIPHVNWTMLVPVVLLVLEFKTSSAVATANGIAVSGTMLLTTVRIGVVALSLPSRRRMPFLVALGAIGVVELMFPAANAARFADGGWLPTAFGLALFTLLTTWKRAETLLAARERRRHVPVESFLSLHGEGIRRVPGTAVYLSPERDYVPSVMLHNLKHDEVLHERIVFLTIADDDVPRLSIRERTEVRVLQPGRAGQVAPHYGFMEDPDVSKELPQLQRYGIVLDPMETTFFLGKTTIARAEEPGSFTWRRELFRWMQRNAPATAEYFGLLPERVVEPGTRVSL